MNADSLSHTTRSFYERVRWKMAASIFLAAMGMFCLAYVSTFGGMSNAADYMRKYLHNQPLNDDEQEAAQQALTGGYGFGAFMFFVAFAVFLSAAIYISPMFCGSANEKKMINKPQEIDGGHASYSDPQARPLGDRV